MSKNRTKLKLTENALFLLKSRYLWQDKNGNTIETPLDLIKRVCGFVAKAEKSPELKDYWQKKFEQVMIKMEFWPGTRTLLNAGKEKPQMSNCFVLPIEDSIESIFKTLYDSSVVKKYGGGCGFNFSEIRPAGDIVGDTPGLAAGPVKLMKLFDSASDIYQQQGRYISGNLVALNADHPDILEFISCKEKDGVFPNINISIAATNQFMEAAIKNEKWKLINPRNKEIVTALPAGTILRLAAHYAHKSGDPGMLFLDNINKDNPTLRGMGPITATNPCGEQPLYPYEACNLGYINLTRFIKSDKNVKKKEFDFEHLRDVCKIAVRFMDNIVELSWFPLIEITNMVRGLRRIGLGVCGWADCLAMLEIPYDDSEAFKLAEKVMKVVSDASHEASLELGEEKGPFPLIEKSIWAKSNRKPRNVTTNTNPPSSNNSIIFNVSFGIEPYFGLVFSQHVMGGKIIQNVNNLLLERLEKAHIKIPNLFELINENKGSIQYIKQIPKDIREVFKTTYDINYKDHIKMQAAFQKYTDNSISKTINLPNSATEDDVLNAYIMAWRLGCKGITVYRDGSKANQVVQFNGKK